MDFFQRQEDARRQTGILILYFSLSVIFTVLAVYFTTVCFILYFKSPSSPSSGTWEHRAVGQGLTWVDHLHNSLPLDPELFLVVMLLVGAVVMLGCFVMVYRLSQGGRSIALMLGGRLIPPDSLQPDEARLRNVVEEMAIASGLPVPEIYILENEPAINAFAAGYGHSDAVIGVTRGTVEKLSRDELQGVIGHEFSHILNGDMTLNMRLSCMTHGILFIAQTGYFLFRILGNMRFSRISSSDKGRSKGGPLPIILLILAAGACLIAIGSIGYFFSSLIKAAISRQREFLADAASVQFTRNPGGLAGALKKIGGLGRGSRLQTAQASDASHFFFSRGTGTFFDNLFSTHPPLTERIMAIDPHFSGEIPEIGDSYHAEDYSGLFESGNLHRFHALAVPATPGSLIARTGQPIPADLQQAAGLKSRIPGSILEAVYEPYSARALIVAILLHVNQDTGPHPEEYSTDARFNTITLKLFRDLKDMERTLFLPLIDLSIPALKQLSDAQFQDFQGMLKAIIESDASISLFEYCLQRVILHHLEPHYGKVRIPKVEFQTLSAILPEATTLLAALARLDAENPDQAEKAFFDGTRQLNISDVSFRLPDPDQATLLDVDKALNLLVRTAPTLKKNILYACATVVMHDQILQAEESELLRAIADSLDCPIPPFARPLSA